MRKFRSILKGFLALLIIVTCIVMNNDKVLADDVPNPIIEVENPVPLNPGLIDENNLPKPILYIGNDTEQTCTNPTDFMDGLQNIYGPFTHTVYGYYLTDGWYVIKGENVIIDKYVILYGDVKLILADNSKITFKDGLYVHSTNKLSIYAQSTDKATMGTLIAKTDRQYVAGIGGIGGREYYYSYCENCGEINIYGGNIIATGGEDAAGIGGGFYGTGGKIAIYGGNITATGGSHGAGIGSGETADAGEIVINAGEVNATGGNLAAGIGGGYGGSGGKITFSGSANVTATGGKWGAGIGGGGFGASGDIYIYGGNTIATGGEEAAGIGGGYKGFGEKITIGGKDYYYDRLVTEAGCKVKAIGGAEGSGIGGGAFGNCGEITITGGEVTSISGDYGAGIGGGHKGAGGIIMITGGEINTTGGYGGAGIGGGANGNCGEITITGGIVTAVAGEYGTGIGGGYEGGDGTIKILGGQITAKSLKGKVSYAIGMGPHAREIYAPETIIILGWTNIDDYIDIDGWYFGTASFAEGKSFVVEGTTTVVAVEDIRNAKIIPAFFYVATFMNCDTVFAEKTLPMNTGIVTAPQDPEDDNDGVFIGWFVGDSTEAFDFENDTISENTVFVAKYTEPIIHDSVKYLDENGDEQSCDNYKLVTSQTKEWKETIRDGWYVLDSDITIDSRINVTGDVKLILCDGKTLNALRGINVSDDNKLTIYAQSIDKATMGALSAKGGDDEAGIGGGFLKAGGKIAITGGIINSTGGSHGAGIGGGYSGAGGLITITGGKVTATGGKSGAGIGGGCNEDNGTITIIGGEVTTTGGKEAASIGGGYVGSGGIINILGGQITAIAYSGYAAIGAGAGETEATITLGWTNDDDYIIANGSYVGAVTFAEGKRFVISGTTTLITVNNIDNAKIIPMNNCYVATFMNCDTVFTEKAVSKNTGIVTVPQDPKDENDGVFVGWFVGESTTAFDFENDTISENTIFYAKFTEPVFDSVKYLDENGDEQSCDNYKLITSKTKEWKETIRDGWYVLDSDITIDSRVNVTGDVKLILCDEKTLIASKGITVEGSNKLTIYAQSVDKTKMGILSATGGSSEAGIGGDFLGQCGIINITGGVIKATGGGCGAGIGGGYNGAGGLITITGGKVTATGGEAGAGIGGGCNKSGGTVTIIGGEVTSTGGKEAASIGGGYIGSGIINILGGQITAIAYSGYAAIGAGAGETEATITLGWTNNDDYINVNGSYVGTVSFAEGKSFVVEGTTTVVTVDDINAAKIIPMNFYVATFMNGDTVFTEKTVYKNTGIVTVPQDPEDENDGVFVGWFVGESTTAFDFENDTISENTIFYAKFTEPVRDSVKYLDENGDEQSCDNYKLITSKTTEWKETIRDGWYVLDEDVTFSSRVTVIGDVKLILCDEKTLTASQGINVDGSNKLTIYAQSTDLSTMGSLTVKGNKSGIGNDMFAAWGQITINGGYITAMDIVKYLDENGEKKLCGNYEIVTSNTKDWKETIKDGWYVVDSDITISDRVTVSGDVKLILCDGKKLTAVKGIKVDGSNKLTIYAQSTDETKMGSLFANGEHYFAAIGSDGNLKAGGIITINGGNVTANGFESGAGIGGGYGGSGGTITINGGNVIATCGGFAAGLGGGEFKSGGKITINGGKVTANGGEHGAGIGGGLKGDGGEITINNGEVIANGKNGGAGIGGGGSGGGAGGTIKIYGGKITATGGKYGAGIGGGSAGDGGTIEINDGNITANGGYEAAGIGGGYNRPAGTITINGGEIHATGGEYGAGIGKGKKENEKILGGKIIITGGTVTATGGNYGAGIGGGEKGDGGEITITGGKVIANSAGRGAGIGSGAGISSDNKVVGGEILISGGEIISTGGIQGAGIGGGQLGAGGKITITGGKVKATGGHYGAGIGGGVRTKLAVNGGEITISGGEVTATGGFGGAGIGGGNIGSADVTTINDGIVIATGGNYASGIGGGQNGAGGKITINGGVVTAIGNRSSSGIGGSSFRSGGEITITGGDITSTGGLHGAGIGSGWKGDGGEIMITGGKITATAGDEASAIGEGKEATGISITLGWTNDDDYIDVKGVYKGTVSFDANKYFMINGTSELASISPNNIDNKKISPAAVIKVNFKVNGHGDKLSNNDESKIVIYGAGYGTLPTPTWKNHNFLGWFTNKEGGEKVTASTVATFAGEQTLYAHWSVDETEAVIKIVWDDEENSEKIRPDSIKVTLSTTKDSFTLSADNNWTATKVSLPKYDDNGDEIDYNKWVFDSVEGYTNSSNISGNVTTVIYSHTLTVHDKHTQNLAFENSKVEKTYGDAGFMNPVSGALTKVTYSILTGEDVAEVDTATGTVTIKKAGTAVIKATAAETGDIAGAGTTFTLTVKKAPVTVKVSDKSKVYGTSDPELTAKVTGLKGNDTLNYSLGRKAGEDAGTYVISATLGENPNYEVTVVNGTFTITAKEVNAPTVVLSETTETYDGTEKKPSVTVKDGESVIPETEYTVSYSGNINAGTATVSILDLTGGNYTVSGTASFEIKKAVPTYSVPTGLTGIKGEKLSSVNLSTGWSWDDGSAELSEAGEKVYKAIYTPADKDNYTVVEGIDVTVAVSEPSNVDPNPTPDPTPNPTPDPTPNPKPDPTPSLAQEPVVEKPTLPQNTTVVENEDGTISPITVEKNKNGSVTTTTVTADAEGNFLKKEVKNENTTKSGTKVVTIATETADKTIKNEEYKEYKNGATSEKVYVYNPAGSSTFNGTVVKKDGTTSTTEKVKDAEGNVQYKNNTEKPDGTSTVTKKETNVDGSKKSYNETTKPDGSSVVTKKETNTDGSSKSYKKTTNTDGSSLSKTVEKDTDGNRTTTTIRTSAEGTMRASQTIVSGDGSKVVFKFSGAISSEPLGDGTTSGEGTGTSDGSMSTEYDGTFKLIALKSEGEVIIIPSAIEEDGKLYAVESIGKKLFFNNKTITEIQIGKYVTKIEAKAFENASNLENIIIYAENLETVERQAFRGISKEATFSIKANKAKYKSAVKLIKDSGVRKTVKFKRIQ